MKKETLLSLIPKTFKSIQELRKFYANSKTGGVYAFQIDNTFYIGSTFRGFSLRFKRHATAIHSEIKGTRKNQNGGNALYPVIVGAGTKNVLVHILYEDALGLYDKEELNEIEVGLMRAYSEAGFSVISDDNKIRMKPIELINERGEIIQTFPSVRSVEADLKIKSGTVCEVVKGKLKYTTRGRGKDAPRFYFRYSDNNEGSKTGKGTLMKAIQNASSNKYLKSAVKTIKPEKKKKLTKQEIFLSTTLIGECYTANQLKSICQRLGMWEQYYLYAYWDGHFRREDGKYIRINCEQSL